MEHNKAAIDIHLITAGQRSRGKQQNEQKCRSVVEILFLIKYRKKSVCLQFETQADVKVKLKGFNFLT